MECMHVSGTTVTTHTDTCTANCIPGMYRLPVRSGNNNDNYCQNTSWINRIPHIYPLLPRIHAHGPELRITHTHTHTHVLDIIHPQDVINIWVIKQLPLHCRCAGAGVGVHACEFVNIITNTPTRLNPTPLAYKYNIYSTYIFIYTTHILLEQVGNVEDAVTAIV